MRQTTRTANQLKNCVKDSYFIVQNTNMIPYVKNILKEIDREDIKIESLYFITNKQYYGIEMSGLVLDHSISLSENLIMSLYNVLPALPKLKYNNYNYKFDNKSDIYYVEKCCILDDVFSTINLINSMFFLGFLENENLLFLYNVSLAIEIHSNFERELKQTLDYFIGEINDINTRTLITHAVEKECDKWKSIHLDLINRGI